MQPNPLDSRDDHPWCHPYLTDSNIGRFRSYSEGVWQFAREYADDNSKPLSCAFAVNMAQNMYKWARLAEKYGVRSTLFLHPMDTFPISMPPWEDFDGSWEDLKNGSAFMESVREIQPEVTTRTITLESEEFCVAYSAFQGGNCAPLLGLLSQSETLRLEVFENNLHSLATDSRPWLTLMLSLRQVRALAPMLADNLTASFRWVAICKSTAGEAMRSEGQCCGLSIADVS